MPQLAPPGLLHAPVLTFSVNFAELQIRGGIEDNSKIIFLISHDNICYDLSLEPSRRDGSNGGSPNLFLRRNMVNYP